MKAVLAALAALLVLSCGSSSSTAPPVPYTWFCRVWPVGAGLAAPSGNACIWRPETYKPPWPYLSEYGGIIYPTPSPAQGTGG